MSFTGKKSGAPWGRRWMSDCGRWMTGPVLLYQRAFPYGHNERTDTTKDEKWLVLVGRPSLAASRWRARRPAPPSYFHIK